MQQAALTWSLEVTGRWRLVGRTVDARATSRLVEVFYDGELVKTHVRARKGGKRTDWSDFPPEKVAAVDGLGDLGQDVAGYQGRLALVGQAPGQLPKPPDPSGSRLLAGSSRINTWGSPSGAVARPRCWRMPRERPLTRRSASSCSRTDSRAPSTREGSMRPAIACTGRWSRAVRPGWKLDASSTAATRCIGCGSSR